MTDEEALNFLVDKMGRKARLAEALGVRNQVLGNWYERGISAERRPEIWAMVNDRGGHLPREWMFCRPKDAA